MAFNDIFTFTTGHFSIYILLVTIEVAYSDEQEIRKIMKNAGYSVYKEILERGKYLSKVRGLEIFSPSLLKHWLE